MALLRRAASFVLAARDNGYSEQGEELAVAAAAGCRTAMAQLASASTMDVWYSQLSYDLLMKATPDKQSRQRLKVGAKSARTKNSQKALTKLSETVDGKLRIRSQPPLLEPLRDLKSKHDGDQWRDLRTVRGGLRRSEREGLPGVHPGDRRRTHLSQCHVAQHPQRDQGDRCRSCAR